MFYLVDIVVYLLQMWEFLSCKIDKFMCGNAVVVHHILELKCEISEHCSC